MLGCPAGGRRITCTSAYFSKDGSFLAVVSPENVKVIRMQDGKEVLVVTAPGAQAAAFSPQNTFLQIFQKPTGQSRNFSVRKVEGGEVVYQQFQKQFSRENWYVNHKRLSLFLSLSPSLSPSLTLNAAPIATLPPPSGPPSSSVKMSLWPLAA